MASYETFTHDVLVIGSGGAGLRAAIEASSSGVKVAMVCRSLLGKAHTVMAEGGVAAALGNVDDRDSWKVHFADTMRGGQYLNNWRMAELHAKEAPDRVRELEAWGAVFDRTDDGKILHRSSSAKKTSTPSCQLTTTPSRRKSTLVTRPPSLPAGSNRSGRGELSLTQAAS